MPENNLKDILEKCLINKIDHYKRTCFQLALFFDYIGSNGKSVCLKCQRKKMTTQRKEVCWLPKYYFTKFPSK